MMLTEIDRIEGIIRNEHGGRWYLLFRQVDGGHRFYPTGETVTQRAFAEIKRRFGVGDGAHLTPEERKINALRWRAERACD